MHLFDLHGFLAVNLLTGLVDSLLLFRGPVDLDVLYKP